MPYTTMRNSPGGGKVIVRKWEIEIVSPDNLRATFPLTAALLLYKLASGHPRMPTWFETEDLVLKRSSYLAGLSIKPPDEAVVIRLKKLLGNGDLMIVSRRGLLRAARLAQP